MLTFLEMEPMQQNAPVKIAILNFLNTLFSDKLGTFVRRKRFIDTYIPYIIYPLMLHWRFTEEKLHQQISLH